MKTSVLIIALIVTTITIITIIVHHTKIHKQTVIPIIYYQQKQPIFYRQKKPVSQLSLDKFQRLFTYHQAAREFNSPVTLYKTIMQAQARLSSTLFRLSTAYSIHNYTDEAAAAYRIALGLNPSNTYTVFLSANEI